MKQLNLYEVEGEIFDLTLAWERFSAFASLRSRLYSLPIAADADRRPGIGSGFDWPS